MIGTLYRVLFAPLNATKGPSNEIHSDLFPESTWHFMPLKRQKEYLYSEKPALHVSEIVEHIFSYLESRDLGVMVKVCKNWHRIGSPLLFNHLCFIGEDAAQRVRLLSREWNRSKSGRLTNEYLEDARVITRQIQNCFTPFSLVPYDEMKRRISRWMVDGVMSRFLYTLGVHPHPKKPDFVCRQCRQTPLHLQFNGDSIVEYNHFQMEHTHNDCTSNGTASKVTGSTIYNWSIPRNPNSAINGRHVTVLSLYKVRVSDEMLSPILCQIPFLQIFTVIHCPTIGDASVHGIVRAAGSSIRRLELMWLDRVSDESMLHVAQHCPNLTYLDVSECRKITEISLNCIVTHCHELAVLIARRLGVNDQTGHTITDRFLRHIGKKGFQSKIHTLMLGGCYLKPHDYKAFLKTPVGLQLTNIEVSFSQMGQSRSLVQIVEFISRLTDSLVHGYVGMNEHALWIKLANGRNVAIIGHPGQNIMRRYSWRSMIPWDAHSKHLLNQMRKTQRSYS